MNRNILLLILLFLILAAGAWYAIQTNAQKDNTRVSWDMEFAVEDPDVIHKIFLADRKGNQITLKRGDDGWMVNDRFPVRPTALSNLMEVLKNVVVWYVPSKGVEPMMVQSLAADGIKVELYNKDDNRIKTYYVGGVTNDERGTFMMMEGSDQPYVVHIPYFVGQLRVRYLMKEDEWRDRAIFSEKPEDISSITVEYPQSKTNSFALKKVAEAEYVVEPFFSTTPQMQTPQRKGYAEAYLLQFESLIAEAFENQNRIRDSITNLVPFAIVTVMHEDSTVKQARFWPVEVRYNDMTRENYVDRYFTETNQPSFMLTQQRVFGPIFRSYDYFFERKVRN